MIDLQCQGYMKGIIANPLLRASATAALVCLLCYTCFAIPATAASMVCLLSCVYRCCFSDASAAAAGTGSLLCIRMQKISRLHHGGRR